MSGGGAASEGDVATFMANRRAAEEMDQMMNSALGDSMVSLDAADILMDESPAPLAPTRPQPQAWAHTSSSRLMRDNNNPNLNYIMNEQRAEQLMMADRQQVQQPEYDMGFADAAQIQEEEMMRIAMERSIADMNTMQQSFSSNSTNHSFVNMQQSCSNLSVVSQVSQISQNSDLVVRVQSEAERTEAVIETPHTEGLPSASRSGRRVAPQKQPSASGSARRRDVRRSNSGCAAQSPQAPSRSSTSISSPTGSSSAIRIGPFKAASCRNLTGAEAVLAIARKNLSPLEVEMIEQALRLGNVKSVASAPSSAGLDSRSQQNMHRNESQGRDERRGGPRRGARPGLPSESRHSSTENSSNRSLQQQQPRTPSNRSLGGSSRNLQRHRSEDGDSRHSSSENNGSRDLRQYLSDSGQNPGGSPRNLQPQLRSGSSRNLGPQENGDSRRSSSCENISGSRDLRQYRSGSSQNLSGSSRNLQQHRSGSSGSSRSLAAQEKEDSRLTSSENSGSRGPGGSSHNLQQHRSEYELQFRAAGGNLSEEELFQIQEALGESVEAPGLSRTDYSELDINMHRKLPGRSTSGNHISREDEAAIELALLEADREAELQSLQFAQQIHREEEEELHRQRVASRGHQGNVRTLTRAELEAETKVGAFRKEYPPVLRHPSEDEESDFVAAGFRMNSSARQEWNRRDPNSVIGPYDEIRTKHDTVLDGQSNAHRLGLDEDEHGQLANVGHTAYNSFMQSVRSNTKKGVAAHGTGRAGSDVDATYGGAMDHNVRLQLGKAINIGLIEKCNGVVKEGKEALIFHANRGLESGGFDVAVKVFKRIQEFKGRGNYVEGDPRYMRENFRNLGSREQLELWTEKEFRNLVRARHAGVPVPTPLLVKENILFMRFLGTDGWPAPQLRELNFRLGSKKWETLYVQIMDSIRRLYKNGRLVHGDLSEYNILVVPSCFVDNCRGDVIATAEEDNAFIPVLIDFGQAVDRKHPSSVILLQRDLERIKSFFSKRGVETMAAEEALAFVVRDEECTVVV